uniref:P-type ATPase C-terminal domain-containing protein n=1 Tax=Haptolina ericina TaxID=156174 RepID=A0A7S3FBL2_9EUKA
MTMFFWSCFALGSGTLLLPSIFTDLLNPVMVTSLPILLYPIFDTDVSKQDSLSFPALYSAGIARIHYTHTRLACWVIEGVYTAALCAYLPTFCIGVESTISVSEISFACMWAVCITIDARLVLENHSWTALDGFGLVAMLLVLLIWAVLFTYILNDDPGSFGWGFLYGTGRLFGRASFWLVLLLCVLASLAPRAIFLAHQTVFRGSKLTHLIGAASEHLSSNSRRSGRAVTLAKLPGVPSWKDDLSRDPRDPSRRDGAGGARAVNDPKRRTDSNGSEASLTSCGQSALTEVSLRARSAAAAFSVDEASANHVLGYGQHWGKLRAVTKVMMAIQAAADERELMI